MNTTPYHVYAEDGFETAHKSQSAAEKAAKRGAIRRKLAYSVVAAGASGMTGGGHGTTVARFDKAGKKLA